MTFLHYFASEYTMRSFYIGLLFMVWVPLMAQTGLVADYDFTDCSLQDRTGNYPAVEFVGSATCNCGMEGDGVDLNGSTDGLNLPNDVRNVFNTDFTFDFYFYVEPSTSAMDIFSARSQCRLDSLFSIRYLPTTQEVLFEMARDVSNLRSLRKRLELGRCWTRITLVRASLNYTLYVDNEPVGVINASQEVPFGLFTRFAFSNSVCLDNNLSRLRGKVDDIRLFNRALSRTEITQSYAFPEQIISRDTTIFSGGQAQLFLGPTCSTIANWNTTEGLDDPMSLSPIASPEMTTTYILLSQVGTCVGRDSVTVFVVNEEEQDCSQLLVPNAFTPNGDNLNDLIGISNTFIVQEIMEFRIIDRFGTEVFNTRDKNGKWNGSTGGVPNDPGVYTYQVNYTCQGQSYKSIGNITLIK